MSAMSDYLENKLVDHIFRATAFTMPAALHVGLFTAAPSDAGGGTEVAGNAYARAQLNPSASNWANTQNSGTGASTGNTGATSNSVAITFPTPTGAWGLVTHFGIFDAAAAGNLIAQGALTASKSPTTGDTVNFPPGSLVATFA